MTELEATASAPPRSRAVDTDAASLGGRWAFLFTDLEGSTRAWEDAPDVMNEVLARHDTVLRTAIASCGGRVFSTAGDAFAASFADAGAAIEAAVAAQRALAVGPWPGGLDPAVRMGVHVGFAYERDDNYFGPTLNRAARIMSAAHGGQVVVSSDVVADAGVLPAGVSTRRLGAYHLKGVSGPVEICQLVVSDLRRNFPPLNTLATVEVRVPRARTSFVGREREMADLADRLLGGGVVTLVAAGGTGKTRLSHEVALAVAGSFVDGVFTLELADAGPDEVIDRAARAVLGEAPLARTEGRGDLLGVLRDHLATRSVLLVIDNCEHVLDEVARLVQTLGDVCPGVAVLATSRERLGVHGEQVVHLAPLSTVVGSDGRSVAVTLFCDRARAADASFEPDDEQLAAVARICREVDGLPLAIELAASRVGTLSVDQIAERLGDALGLLRSRRTGTSPRHHSLEATIAWSYEQLDADEQTLLGWTSTFVGGFSVEAFEALCVAALGRADGLDLLESLRDKSLFGVDVVGGATRFRLAAPIRQFAAARLDESGRRAEAEMAHLDYFQALGRNTPIEIDERPDQRVVTALAAENENFLGAIRRAAGRGDTSAALKMAIGLHTFWEETGNLAEASEIIESLIGDDLTDPVTFQGLGVLVAYGPMCGNMRRAGELADLLRPALEQPLPPMLAGRLRFTLGFLDSARGDLTAAAGLWADAAAQLDDVDVFLARQALWSAAHSFVYAGRWDDGRSNLDRALALPPPVQGWFPHQERTTRALIDIYTTGDGVDRLVAGVTALDELGLRFRLLLASVDATLGLFRAGRPDAAQRWWRGLLDIGLEAGNLWTTMVALEFAAWTQVEQGDDQRAGELWGCLDAFALERGYGWWELIARGDAERRALVAERSPEALAAGLAAGATRTLHEEAATVAASPILDEGIQL